MKPDRTEFRGSPNRRSVLKTIGASGIAAYIGTGVGTAGGPEMERVPRVKSGDEVVEWMEVPKRWLQRSEAVKNATQGFTNNRLSEKGIQSVGMVPRNKEIAGKRTFEINVEIDPDKFDGGIPDTYQGEPVKKSEMASDDMGPNCHNDQNYDPMPGGVWIEGDSAAPRGTTFGMVEYNNTFYMLTALHLFGDNNCNNYNIGDDVDQYSQNMGALEGFQTDYDLALCSHDNGIAVSHSIDGESQSWDVKGYASEVSMRDRAAAWNDSYKMMGTSTGIQTGGIGETHKSISNCYTFGGHGARGSADGAAGDSGGPAFAVEGGEAVYLYLHSWGTGGKTNTYNSCADEYTWEKTMGTAAYAINNSGYKIFA